MEPSSKAALRAPHKSTDRPDRLSERSLVATTTVAAITIDEPGRWRRKFGIEFELKVLIETNNYHQREHRESAM